MAATYSSHSIRPGLSRRAGDWGLTRTTYRRDPKSRFVSSRTTTIDGTVSQTHPRPPYSQGECPTHKTGQMQSQPSGESVMRSIGIACFERYFPCKCKDLLCSDNGGANSRTSRGQAFPPLAEDTMVGHLLQHVDYLAE